MKRQVTCIIIGAGARGNTYAWYSEHFPEEMRIVGVADPNELRLVQMAQRYDVPSENVREDWRDLLARPKFADAVILATPDNLHYEPAMQILEKGYDLLLEKPIAQTWEECYKIGQQAQKYGNIVAVCHVLRYTPYFRELKKIIESGAIGRLISVQHLEPVEHAHTAHSYVRGNWANSKYTTPMILAKSCHDLDILRWLIGKPCKSIAAFGHLTWFKAENAPEGSTARCTDGCTVEQTCPYSALKIYHPDNHRFSYVFDLPHQITPEARAAYLRDMLATTSPYGRCVYRCDNDQPDHYVVAMEFEENITVSFSMEAFTSYEGRRTRLMGSMGDVVGDMNEFVLTDFRNNKKTTWRAEDMLKHQGYAQHGGGDFGIVRDFLQAVATRDSSWIYSTLEDSIQSHYIGFKAEESRLQKQMIKL